MDVQSAFDLTGRVAVVTGGASGIGESTAETLAAAGASVVLGDVDTEGAQAVAKRITDGGGQAVAQSTDITQKADLDALADLAVSEFGRLDAFCNIAGVAGDGPLTELTEEQFDKIVAINLKGTLFGCQAAARVMIPQGSGSIVNVASAAIDIAVPNYGLYAITKSGVAQITKTLATEIGKHGVRVNTIAPGMTITKFTARHLYEEDGSMNQERYDEFVERMKKMTLVGRVGEPVDQAMLILFLVSDAGRYCTGQIWRSNGGQAIV